MEDKEEQELNYNLKELVPLIIDFTNKFVSINKIVPKRKADYVYFTIESITYEKTGLKINNQSAKIVTKEEVNSNILYLAILPEIKKTYIDNINKINEILNKYGQVQYVDNFISRIIGEILKKPEFKSEEADRIIEIFVKQLKNATLHFTSKIEMEGIILTDETPIEININNTKLIFRRPVKEDLEQEDTITKRLYSPPWAIMDIAPITLVVDVSMEAEYGQYVQHVVLKLLTALRLFGVGSVCYSRYNINTEWVAQILSGGVFFNRYGTFNISNRYEIKGSDARILEQFCTTIFSKLSDNGDVGDRLSYKNFAFERYTDSLTKFNIPERRIAETVMGLESLYINNGNGELRFRVSTLASRVIGLLEYDDALYANKLLRYAYDIRSQFVHGNLMNKEERAKLIKQYESEDKFLSKLLDYLRLSIIVYLLTVTNKDTFLELLSDSLVNAKKKEELIATHIKPAKEIL